jgi:two-component system response regulator RpaA
MQIHSTKQAAELLNTTPREVTRWCDSGRLKSYRLPGTQSRRIPHEFLTKFAAENGLSVRSQEGQE